MIAEFPTVFVSKTMRQTGAEDCSVPVSTAATYIAVDFSGMALISSDVCLEDDAADAAIVESRRSDPRSNLSDVLARLNKGK